MRLNSRALLKLARGELNQQAKMGRTFYSTDAVGKPCAVSGRPAAPAQTCRRRLRCQDDSKEFAGPPGGESLRPDDVEATCRQRPHVIWMRRYECRFAGSETVAGRVRGAVARAAQPDDHRYEGGTRADSLSHRQQLC